MQPNEYVQYSQNQYLAEKAIPQVNPLQRPQELAPNNYANPTPSPLNTLLQKADPPQTKSRQSIVDQPQQTNRSDAPEGRTSITQYQQPYFQAQPAQTQLYVPRPSQNQIDLSGIPQKVNTMPLASDKAIPNYNYPTLGQNTMNENEQKEKEYQLLVQNEQLKTQVKQLDAQNKGLQQQNEETQSTIQNLRNQLKLHIVNEQENNDLKNLIIQLKQEKRLIDQTVQQQEFQLQEIPKLKKQLEQFQGLEDAYRNQESKLSQLSAVNKDQQRQLQDMDQLVKENNSMKQFIESQKVQNRERDLQLERLKAANESMLNDNKKMKSYLDMLNSDYKKAQDANTDLNKAYNALKVETNATQQSQQNNIMNLTSQVDQQKNQIIHLEAKEKELQRMISVCNQQEVKLRSLAQQTNQQQQEIEAMKNQLQIGKAEYSKLVEKFQSADKEIWRLKDVDQKVQLIGNELVAVKGQLGVVQQQKEKLQQQCQAQDQILHQKGEVEAVNTQLKHQIQDMLSQSKQVGAEQHQQIEKWKSYADQLQGEIKKRDLILQQLDEKNKYIINQSQQALQQQAKEKEMLARDAQGKMQALEGQLVKEKEMIKMDASQKFQTLEGRLMQYDRDNQSLKQQIQLMSDKIRSLEMECQKLQESLYREESQKRQLETDLSNLQFQQQLQKQYQVESPGLQFRSTAFGQTKFGI